MEYKCDGIKVADNIRAERCRKNKTQAEIADFVGVSLKTYIGYEKDATKISGITILLISLAIGCNINDFYLNTISTKCE